MSMQYYLGFTKIICKTKEIKEKVIRILNKKCIRILTHIKTNELEIICML